MKKGGGMITVEAKKVGARVIATVKVAIGTGHHTYTVQFADQGSEAANEAEAQRELRRTLEEVLEALGPS
jgi:heterodisulfide reductase subunit B